MKRTEQKKPVKPKDLMVLGSAKINILKRTVS